MVYIISGKECLLKKEPQMRREEERHAIVVYSFKKYVCPKCGHSIGRVN